jgi:MraZ protein
MGRTIHLYDKATYEEQMAAEIPPDERVDFFVK